MTESSVKTLLWILIAIMLLCIISVGAAGYLTLASEARLHKNVIEEDLAFVELAQGAHLKIVQLRRFEKDYFLNLGKPADQQEYLKKYQAIAATVPPLLSRLAAMARADQHLSPEIKEKAAAVAGLYTAYREGFGAAVLRLQAAPGLSPQQANALMDAYRGNIVTLEENLTAVAEAGNRMIALVSDQALKEGRDAMMFIAVVVAIATILAALLGTALSQSIYRAIFREGLRRMAHRM